MHPNTYLTEISFTGKSEEKRGSKNDVLPSASFEVEKRHRTKYIASVKTTQVHFRPINKAKQLVNFFNETYYENKRVKPGMNIYKVHDNKYRQLLKAKKREERIRKSHL